MSFLLRRSMEREARRSTILLRCALDILYLESVYVSSRSCQISPILTVVGIGSMFYTIVVNDQVINPYPLYPSLHRIGQYSVVKCNIDHRIFGRFSFSPLCHLTRKLATDINVSVRLKIAKMLGDWLTSLPDRCGHNQGTRMDPFFQCRIRPCTLPPK